MRMRSSARGPTAAVAVLAALTLALGLGAGAHRAGSLLRGLPRAGVAVSHAVDAHGFPLGHRSGKQPAYGTTVDAALGTTSLTFVALLVLTAPLVRRRPRAVAVPATRPRGPPARH